MTPKVALAPIGLQFKARLTVVLLPRLLGDACTKLPDYHPPRPLPAGTMVALHT